MPSEPGTVRASVDLPLVLDCIPAIAFSTDRQGHVRAWNRSAVRSFGCPSSTVLGRPVLDLGLGWDRERLSPALDAIPDEGIELAQVAVRTTDGQARVFAVSVRALPGGEERVWIWTEVPRRADAITMKLATLGGLAAGIAHEINTPMQFIGDNVRFLAEAITGLDRAVGALRGTLERLDPAASATVDEGHDLRYLLEESPKAVQQTLDGVQRVAEIVKAMKEFAHPGGDALTPTDLNQAIASTVTLSRNVWKYVAEVHLDLDEELPRVQVALGAFQQSVLNLTVNAAHAIEDRLGMPAELGSGAYPVGKGRITIRTRRAGGEVLVEVSDTGCGMTDAVRCRIFEPFFTTKPVGRGTGQGLALVHAEIVGHLHGAIDVESAPGSGSLFRLRIPVVQGASAGDLT